MSPTDLRPVKILCRRWACVNGARSPVCYRTSLPVMVKRKFLARDFVLPCALSRPSKISRKAKFTFMKHSRCFNLEHWHPNLLVSVNYNIM